MAGTPAPAYRARDILAFWFGPDPLGSGLPQRLRLWFGDDASPETVQMRDEALLRRFEGAMAAAAGNELDDWAHSPRRLLALLLLLETMPRQAYRGRARAFMQAPRALQLCLDGIATGADAVLAPVERLFFYQPLQHAESLSVQEQSLSAYRCLVDLAPAAHRRLFVACADLAEQHHRIIARFGRFPHRNAILGRPATADEQAWLDGD